MGGIMASSPELIRAVEERLSGRSFAPGYDLQTPAMRAAVREEGLDYPSFELIRQNTPSRQTLRTLGYPESAVGGSMYFDRMLAGVGLADKNKKMPPFDTALGAGFRTQAAPGATRPLRGEDTPVVAIEKISEHEALRDPEVLRKIKGMSVPELSKLPVIYRDDVINEMRIRTEAAGGAQEPRDLSNLGGGMPSGPRDRGALGREKRTEEELAKKAADAVIDKKMNADAAAPKDLSRKIAAATDRQLQDPEPKSKKDLRSRYTENLALFKEIYGIDDEDRARDKMMSLAMMFLAIAAGQSPNPLTNFAQGALTGLKSMSESAEARRQEQRDLKTAALEAAMSSEAAAADAEARAAGRAYDRETEMILQAMKNEAREDTPEGEKQRQEYLYNDVFRTTLSAELENNPGNVQAALANARLAAVTAAPQAPSAQAGGAVSPVVGTPGTELPVITTREEFDALPSGAEFIQNGQKRRKP